QFLAIESRKQFIKSQRRLAAILARHRLRRSFQAFEQSRRDNQRPRLSRNFDLILRVQVVHPRSRFNVQLDRRPAGVCQLMNMERVDDSLELSSLDAETLFPGPDGS